MACRIRKVPMTGKWPRKRNCTTRKRTPLDSRPSFSKACSPALPEANREQRRRPADRRVITRLTLRHCCGQSEKEKAQKENEAASAKESRHRKPKPSAGSNTPSSSCFSLVYKISDKTLTPSVANTFEDRAPSAFSPVAAPALLDAHSMLRVTG